MIRSVLSPGRFARLGLLVWVAAIPGCGIDAAGATDVQLPFPDGREVRVRLPSDIVSQTTLRELSFYAERGSIQALVVVTDDPGERRAAESGSVVSVAGAPTPWRLVSGEIGYPDRIILATDHWAAVIGIPDDVNEAEGVADLVEFTEDAGLPVIGLRSGTYLVEPRLEEASWLYLGSSGEWKVAFVGSCDERPNVLTETTVEWCNDGLGLHLHAFGEAQFVERIRESLEVISRFVGSA